METKAAFLHFAPGEKLPKAGDTLQQTGVLSHLRYQFKIREIVGEPKELHDGRIQLKVVADYSML